MNNSILLLEKSLKTGFIDKTVLSNNEYQPKFLTNDKISKTKILTTMKRELDNCDEFWFSVAFLTTGGIATLFNTLEELKTKNIKGKILVSQYLNFTQPEALKRLLQFTNIESKIVVNGNFHAKGFLFKKVNIYNLIVGSSNLTADALSVNKEWNLKISATNSSSIINDAVKEFSHEFDNAVTIDTSFIEKYSEIYMAAKQTNLSINNKFYQSQKIELKPNNMQREALSNLKELRSKGMTRSLLISATGTGKTYLSAFDVKRFNPKRFLFIVHRRNIAQTALDTFKSVFNNEKSMGLYSGSERNKDSDFIFATIQTISRDEHLQRFDPKHFDYIVIDETHRAGADSYQKIINYFKPNFLLGMTATPERTDGMDIFKMFNHNIAYEIRLHNAMEENMLSPFHYFGVSDISIDEKLLKEKNAFNLLTTDERVNRILENIKKYGVDNGIVRGLIFCSTIKESEILSEKFNNNGYRTISLSSIHNEEERELAISRLETNNLSEKLDYIFTVDIFNEGIDIPSVNQIVMLRPTQSAIIFVQQLGRGLRKTESKEYLTVIDFIGNYSNNYLVPIALYGDTSYNKDNLRKSMASNLLPGSSTINFDRISLERIYKSIDTSNLQLRKDLVNDYKLLKYKLGHIPMMLDFIENKSRDPFTYVNYSKSFLNFVMTMEDDLKNKLTNNKRELQLLEYICSEINNAKRVEETIILKILLETESLEMSKIKQTILNKYNYNVSDETIISSINNLNLKFITEKDNKKLISVQEKYDFRIVTIKNNIITLDNDLILLLKNDTCKKFLLDSIDYSLKMYDRKFSKETFHNGFILYQKYSRKDVFRILNWKQNPLAQNVGGYIVSPDKSNCPIFVNYHKEEDISHTTKYEDSFVNNTEFTWMSKSKRKLTSPDIMTIKNNTKLRLPLFVKKSNDEGTEFYYMGDLSPIENSFEETYMPSNEDDKKVSVVRINFKISHPVDESILDYIIHNHS